MVESITNAKKTPSEVRSFLGITGYVPRFIPQYSISFTEPLRRLTRQKECQSSS